MVSSFDSFPLSSVNKHLLAIPSLTTSYSFSGLGRLLDESSESSSQSRLTTLTCFLRASRTGDLGVSHRNIESNRLDKFI